MNTLNQFEASLLYQLHHAISSPALDVIAKGISWLGNNGGFFLLLVLALLLGRKTRYQGGVLALALLLSLLFVNLGLKPVIGRMRPYLVLDSLLPILSLPHDASFPSGHTAVAFATAFAMRPSGKWVFRGLLLLAILMGLSRLYLLVHYPSDVLFGALMGSFCGICSVWLWKKVGDCGKIS